MKNRTERKFRFVIVKAVNKLSNWENNKDR